MAEEQTDKPVDKVNDGNDKVTQLEKQVNELRDVVAKLVGLVESYQKIQEDKVMPPPPPPPPPPPHPATGQDAAAMGVLPLLMQMFQPKQDDLSKLFVSKAIEAMLATFDTNRAFTESIMTAISSAFGKKAGEKIATLVVSNE